MLELLELVLVLGLLDQLQKLLLRVMASKIQNLQMTHRRYIVLLCQSTQHDKNELEVSIIVDSLRGRPN